MIPRAIMGWFVSTMTRNSLFRHLIASAASGISCRSSYRANPGSLVITPSLSRKTAFMLSPLLYCPFVTVLRTYVQCHSVVDEPGQLLLSAQAVEQFLYHYFPFRHKIAHMPLEYAQSCVYQARCVSHCSWFLFETKYLVAAHLYHAEPAGVFRGRQHHCRKFLLSFMKLIDFVD